MVASYPGHRENIAKPVFRQDSSPRYFVFYPGYNLLQGSDVSVKNAGFGMFSFTFPVYIVKTI